jgi:hypothetical protein
MALTSTLNTITLKQGDTLRWLCTFEINSVVQDLTGFNIKAMIRFNGTTLVPLTVTIQNQSTNVGKFEVYASSTTTQLFPVGMATCDIEYTMMNGDRISSETLTLKVLRQVTL